MAVKLWSKKIAREALKQTHAYKFMGTSSNNVVQVFDETQKGPGDRIRVPLRMQLNGRGVGEGEALEGNEEALSTHYDDLVINDMRHAVRVKTLIDQQRIPFSAREEARMGLQDWYADRIDTWVANAIAGNTAETDILFTGNNTTSAPSSASGNRRIIYADGGSTTEASLSDTTTQRFTVTMLDRAVNIAKTSTPLIRPIRVGSQEYYVCMLHPDQVRDLRTNTNTGSWLDIQKAAMSGGEVEDNPIFTGALGVYNGVVLHEWTRLPNSPDTTNVRRAVFCGAQACAFGWGKGYSDSPKYVEDYFDYESEFGVGLTTIAGCTKLVFNSIDFGSIVISTFASAP